MGNQPFIHYKYYHILGFTASSNNYFLKTKSKKQEATAKKNSTIVNCFISGPDIHEEIQN